MAIKVLLDTDIGSDVDDAICLAYLLANPACELLGITTVTGEAVERAKMASAQCKMAKQDVPIYPGCERPIFVEQKQVTAPQATALTRWPHEKEFPKGEAIEFMRRTIRKHPGEVTLLAIGPLTNVAALFMADQEIPSLLRSLVLMNGMFTRRVANWGPREWNAFGDPAATGIVYQAPVKKFQAVGIDVTAGVTMPPEEVRKRFDVPMLRPVRDFAEVWFQHYPVMYFHDPLAAAVIFDDQICGFDRGKVDVELTSERLAGYTYWKTDPQGPHEVALRVDGQRFFDHFFSFFKA